MMKIPLKIPAMSRSEYDDLIRNGSLCRIAFCGEQYPYIAPFLYVFDQQHLYFLSTRYGRKMQLFARNPLVSVEIEDVSPDMGYYRFVTLQGKLSEVTDEQKKADVRRMFAEKIFDRQISVNSMAALGHRPSDTPETIVTDDRTMVWKLVDVFDIVALKNG